jgi:uncharacterized protein with NRDE domain
VVEYFGIISNASSKGANFRAYQKCAEQSSDFNGFYFYISSSHHLTYYFIKYLSRLEVRSGIFHETLVL